MGFKAKRSGSEVESAKKTAKRATKKAAKNATVGVDVQPPIPVLPLHETIRRAIQVAVTVHPSLRAAARALEMPPSSLRDKLDQFGIDMPGARPNRAHPCQPAFTVRRGRSRSDD